MTDARLAARRYIEVLTGRSEELIDRIERTIGEGERQSRPAPDAWSLTEIVQHLALVAGGMLRTARPAGRSFPYGGRVKLASLRRILRSPLKIRAPVAAIVPRPGVTWVDASRNLAGSNLRWKAFVDGDDFTRTAFRHPFVGRLGPAETAGFLVEHFEHHVRQVDRLIAWLEAERRG